jgi:hypothetical protein
MEINAIGNKNAIFLGLFCMLIAPIGIYFFQYHKEAYLFKNHERLVAAEYDHMPLSKIHIKNHDHGIRSMRFEAGGNHYIIIPGNENLPALTEDAVNSITKLPGSREVTFAAYGVPFATFQLYDLRAKAKAELKWMIPFSMLFFGGYTLLAYWFYRRSKNKTG